MLGLVFRTLTSFQALHFKSNKISNLLHACITIDFCPFCYPVPNCTDVALLEFIFNQKQIKMDLFVLIYKVFSSKQLSTSCLAISYADLYILENMTI